MLKLICIAYEICVWNVFLLDIKSLSKLTIDMVGYEN